jgi:hypothetical protein
MMRRRQELLEGPFMPVHRDPQSGDVLYTWTTGETIKRLLAVEDELLRSEGIDPPWVPFTEAELATRLLDAGLLSFTRKQNSSHRTISSRAVAELAGTRQAGKRRLDKFAATMNDAGVFE